MKQAMVVAACAGYAGYCLFVGTAGIRTSPDSVFYLSFSPIVPTGYSVLLRLLGAEGAVILQPLLYATGLAWLGLEVLRQWSSLPLALGVIAGSVAMPELASFHSSILTESLFMSCELLMLASIVRFLRRPGWRTAALSGIFAGLSATVRNAGYAFFPVLLTMALMNWRRRGASGISVLMAITLPMAASIAAERAIAYTVNGNQATSLLGRHMFAKAALIEAPRRPTSPPDPARSVIEEYLDGDFSRVRQAIANAPPDIRSLLTVYYETCLQGPCARQMRDASIGALPEATQNTILANVAFQRIVHSPLNFAKLTLMHYVSLWTVYKQAHPDTTPILNEYLAAHRPLPYESLAFSWRDPKQVLQFQADPRIRVLQPAVAVIAWDTGALALVALILGALRQMPSSLAAMAALSALAAHAGVLFSAIFAPGISRFTLSFWPAVMSAVVLECWFLLQRAETASQRSDSLNTRSGE